MRILHVGKYYPPTYGGIETVTQDLVEGTNAAGVRCDVLVSSEDGTQSFETVGEGKRAYTIYRARGRLKVASTPISLDFIRLFRKLCPQYDVVLLHLPNPLAGLALFMSGYTGKVGLIWHSDIVRQKRLLVLFKGLQTWMINRADVIIGATPAHVEQSDWAAQMVGKTAIIPFGLSTRQGTDANLVQAPRGDKGKIEILAVGRLVSYKGFDVLLKAMAQLPETYHLNVVGTGPLHGSLVQLRDALGLEDRAQLTGRLSDDALAQRLRECDIVTLPSVTRAEMYGMVMLEAMAAGKPIVATTIARSGTQYVNRHGETGLNVEPGDASLLADALKRLGEDPGLREQFGAEGLAVFDAEFRMERVISRHVALYEDLCARESKSAEIAEKDS